jgi:hypothetical protein
MDDKQIQTLEQVKQFVASSQTIEFRGVNTNEKYQWLKRNGKGVLRKYVEKVTGYSRSQVARLVGQYQESGRIRVRISDQVSRLLGAGRTPSRSKSATVSEQIGRPRLANKAE